MEYLQHWNFDGYNEKRNLRKLMEYFGNENITAKKARWAEEWWEVNFVWHDN